jgi:hypothetical protein
VHWLHNVLCISQCACIEQFLHVPSNSNRTFCLRWLMLFVWDLKLIWKDYTCTGKCKENVLNPSDWWAYKFHWHKMNKNTKRRWLDAAEECVTSHMRSNITLCALSRCYIEGHFSRVMCHVSQRMSMFVPLFTHNLCDSLCNRYIENEFVVLRVMRDKWQVKRDILCNINLIGCDLWHVMLLLTYMYSHPVNRFI